MSKSAPICGKSVKKRKSLLVYPIPAGAETVAEPGQWEMVHGRHLIVGLGSNGNRCRGSESAVAGRNEAQEELGR
jgi:hypothetical protein